MKAELDAAGAFFDHAEMVYVVTGKTVVRDDGAASFGCADRTHPH